MLLCREKVGCSSQEFWKKYKIMGSNIREKYESTNKVKKEQRKSNDKYNNDVHSNEWQRKKELLHKYI